MSEKIYTISVNEAFEACAEDKSRGCPFCRLYNKLEADETDLILGAAMMEPDVRIKTNEEGFCATHFQMLLSGKNRLGLGLMLESHTEQLKKELADKGLAALVGRVGIAAPRRVARLETSCYICDRIEYSFSRMLSNAVLLWSEDKAFREKVKAQPYICLPHFGMWLAAAEKELKRGYPDFYREVSEPVYACFDSLREDISWFCKKFDYRYDAEPWGNAKDAPDRAGKFLCGDLHKPIK